VPLGESTEGGEDRSIAAPVPDTSVALAFEDAHLVAEHHDLELFVRLGPPPGDDEAEEAAEAEVEQGEGHGRCCPRSRGRASSGPDRISGPLHLGYPRGAERVG
jgi:hypothetical protein